ncbi:ribosome biogenesis GTP-binding protein YihA/YsxC [Buchnera aphidicola]|uniref:ribosome biogenesis GTP-binding protein YihA/YsxC n=1 Tax=Buchnera aphidicola TaxID=9 RepID=UPI003464D609
MVRFLMSGVNVKKINIKKYKNEIIFIGYSNSGKSSVINCLTNNNKLSRCSKFPGRTKMMNFFEINNHTCFVDFPGYGYSKISDLKINKNHSLIFSYIKYRFWLTSIVLLIDIRRLIRVEDKKILLYLKKKKVNIVILLNKCDKMKFYQQKKQLCILRKRFFLYTSNIKIILFSSFKKIGVNEFFDYFKDYIE